MHFIQLVCGRLVIRGIKAPFWINSEPFLGIYCRQVAVSLGIMESGQHLEQHADLYLPWVIYSCETHSQATVISRISKLTRENCGFDCSLY